ncbi:MAG: thiamine pyrophosphate-binding protein [Chlamydiota bacterium]|nr:thiamine pyrophosphate-binding protein [Chlamydiota bacterium]
MPANLIQTEAMHLYRLLKEHGFNFFTGVPCSFLSELIEILEAQESYIPAVREDQAIGLASGAYLAGRKPVVLMQNSGIGVSINALASLNLIYKIPILMIISMRGYQIQDAPEHWIMGQTSTRLLEDIGVPYCVTSPGGLEEDLRFCVDEIEKERISAALLVRKGLLG